MKRNKRRIINKAMLLILLIVVFNCSYSQEQNEISSPELEIQEFFRLYEQDIGDALFFLLRSPKSINVSDASINELEKQLNESTDQIGKYIGSEKILKRHINESIELHSYLVRYGSQPLRFTFVYYKPQNKWRIYNFSYDDDILEELEKSAQLFLTDEVY